VTPIPIDRASSRPSLLVRPSSRANSYTRIFLAKLLLVLFFFFARSCALYWSATKCRSHPRMFSSHREQQLYVAGFDLGAQRPAKRPAAPGVCDTGGFSQLGIPLPAKPGTTARAFPSNYKLAAGTYNYTDQCTGNPSRPAPDTGPDRGWRLPHSFP
jgi:hypothetical protein